MNAPASLLGQSNAPASAKPVVRVLVVDDSAIVRGLISRQLETDPAIKVVASAPHGEAALSELGRREVDVVLLDIEMPVMDGLTALPLILAAHPKVKVIIVSTLTRRNAEISLRALQLGASDYVTKPEGGLGSAEDFKREVTTKVKALGAKRQSVLGAVSGAAALTTHRPIVRAQPTALAIGSSTGGPPALLTLFEALKGGVKQPIFLTQHMPPTFTTLLAEQLTRVSGRLCQEGRDGEPVEAGRCYVAPGGWHMIVERGRTGPIIRLNQAPPENYCRPAVDPLFRSLAQVYGAGVVGVILTGMGADGAAGCLALANAGGRFIAQDEASSVVWGMPAAAANTGRADKVLSLTDIGPWVKIAMGSAL
jgi:two-component system chemotaxis response regulator CheB